MTMNPVLHSFAYCLDYLREQVADIPSDEMMKQPSGTRNHPAWIIGHLTFACQMVGGVVGLPDWLPEDWAKRFAPGSMPVTNPAVYEPKEQLLQILGDAQGRLVRAVEQTDDHILDQPFPDEAYLEVFPTIRHALTHVMVGHTSHHIGQLMVWRRGMGLAPMQRSFE